MSESNIQKLIQLTASELGVLTFRNNIGAYTTPQGYRIKYGVGGTGGSDLIGIIPVVIRPEHVGRTLGIFAAIEVKTLLGRATPSQENFIHQVNANGGVAGVCRSPDDLQDLINNI
jgi:hypothetical protein